MIQEQIFVSTLNDHEIIQIFKNHAHPLSNKLTEMLNEHYTHQTERRGCGILKQHGYWRNILISHVMRRN